MKNQKKKMILKLVVEIILILILGIFLIMNWDETGETDSTDLTDVTTETKETTTSITNNNTEVHHGTGVLLSEGQIEYIKYAIENKISPNYETWKALLSSPLSNPTWKPRAVETIIRGGNGDNVSKLYIDVARAYQCALIWRLNGSKEHGDCAVRILNAYAKILKCVSGNADRYLAAGLFGYQLANTASIMKEHPDFNNDAMKKMLKVVFYYPLNERFLMGNKWGRDHNDAYISNYFAIIHNSLHKPENSSQLTDEPPKFMSQIRFIILCY